MQANWKEFGLKMGMFVTAIAFIIFTQKTVTLPITEIAVAFIISAELMAVSQPIKEGGQSLSILKWVRKIDNRLIYLMIIGQIILLAFYMPDLYYFMPVFAFEYDIRKPHQLFALLIFIPLLGYLIGQPFSVAIIMTGIAVLTAYMHTGIQSALAFETRAYHQIDRLSAVNKRFRQEQQQLIAVQDLQSQELVRLERKRIVDEIHDILGHQLSSAVIQIGALEYIVKDAQAKESLGQVKNVLNTSMDNIRAVIHAERASTIQFDQALKQLTEDFTKTPIQFVYQNTRPLTNQYAHSILNIVREGLTNINKHSNASKVQLRFVESVDQWHLLLADNGRNIEATHPAGIGLMNMEERVELLGGKMHISKENGFRIFITIPFKEDIDDEDTISG